MRKVPLAPGEFYHIYNRGARKYPLFKDDYDRGRFLFLILYGQSPEPLENVGFYTKNYDRQGKYAVGEKQLEKIITNRFVSLNCFILMDNHFHISVEEKLERGIASYMQKVSTGFTNYLNKKYDESGHAFQGPFRSVHIKDNEQLLYTSAYIHRNITDDSLWKRWEEKYPWSSYQDYVKENRWAGLLKTNSILDQFETTKEYHEWVKTSGAKGFFDEEEMQKLYGTLPF